MGCVVSSSAKPFGGDLSVLWAISPEVPNIITLCGKYLESRPACHEKGIFCTPASRYIDQPPSERGVLDSLRSNPSYQVRVKAIRKYRHSINSRREHTIPWASIVDPVIVAGLFKLFFRQMEPPLLTYLLYDKWVVTQHQENQLAYVVTMRGLFSALPAPNQATLLHVLALFRHLLKPENSEKNGLTRRILAHEFGPIFLRPLRVGQGAKARYRDKDSATTDAVAIACLDRMLSLYNHIFTRRNEEEFVRLARENEELRTRQAGHDKLVEKVKAERLKHIMHKHFLIEHMHSQKRTRHMLHEWRENVRAIRGDRSIYRKLRAAQEALNKSLEDHRLSRAKIAQLQQDLEQSRRRAEMLGVAVGEDIIDIRLGSLTVT